MSSIYAQRPGYAPPHRALHISQYDRTLLWLLVGSVYFEYPRRRYLVYKFGCLWGEARKYRWWKKFWKDYIL